MKRESNFWFHGFLERTYDEYMQHLTRFQSFGHLELPPLRGDVPFPLFSAFLNSTPKNIAFQIVPGPQPIPLGHVLGFAV